VFIGNKVTRKGATLGVTCRCEVGSVYWVVWDTWKFSDPLENGGDIKRAIQGVHL
jgi:hypothetical protein